MYPSKAVVLMLAAGCQGKRAAIDKELLAAKELVRERTDLKRRLVDQVRHALQNVPSDKKTLCSAVMVV